MRARREAAIADAIARCRASAGGPWPQLAIVAGVAEVEAV